MQIKRRKCSRDESAGRCEKWSVDISAALQIVSIIGIWERVLL